MEKVLLDVERRVAKLASKLFWNRRNRPTKFDFDDMMDRYLLTYKKGKVWGDVRQAIQMIDDDTLTTENGRYPDFVYRLMDILECASENIREKLKCGMFIEYCFVDDESDVNIARVDYIHEKYLDLDESDKCYSNIVCRRFDDIHIIRIVNGGV